MIKAISIGNTIVANINGKMFQKEFATTEEKLKVYEKLANSEDYSNEADEAIALFAPPKTEVERQLEIEFETKKEESKKVQDILDFMKEVKENGHEIFEVVENSLYIKGIKISTPELLIKEILKAQENNNTERLGALLNFWKLCALNPDPRARFDLFKFLKNHNLTITPSGHFVAYRTVNLYKSGDSNLEKFVTQEYLKVKRWKKSPKNYYVSQHEGSYFINSTDILHLNKDKSLGILDDLYQNIGSISGNIYTDAHTGTFRIKMGKPVTMQREAVDPNPNESCSYGLHLGNLSFMKSNMGSFGKVGLVCLCNPRNVTSVPEYDSGKMRTCEYLPVAIAELDDNGKIKDVELDVFDYEYAQHTQEELEAMQKLNEMQLAEYKRTEFIAPEVDFKMLRNILDSVTMSVEDANKKLSGRVIKV